MMCHNVSNLLNSVKCPYENFGKEQCAPKWYMFDQVGGTFENYVFMLTH